MHCLNFCIISCARLCVCVCFSSVLRTSRKSSTSTVFPTSTVKHVLMSTCKLRLDKAAEEEIATQLNAFVEQLGSTLNQYSAKVGRATIDLDAVERLFQQQGLVHDAASMNHLIRSHLPMEYVEALIPMAMAGNTTHPACKRSKACDL
eukprot:m.250932 g.250932  ORF g.250932 m.250932 type:complete len:148 (-) comp15445_c4_seq6:605-1048(-)